MAEFILKDWYGKEQTFDHDKIFVKNAAGELIQFTQGEGDIPAVLQDKTITENGTYTADSGYDGLGNVTVNVAGAGGLPAGGYWKAFNQNFNNIGCIVYVLDGIIYFLSRDSDADTKYDIRVFEDGVYTKIATDVFGTAYGTYTVYNGKIHAVGTYGNHYMYSDDWTYTAFTTHSDGESNKPLFVMDGELYKKDKTAFYKWVENGDSWEKVVVANCPTTFYHDLVVHNRNVYIVGSGTIYKVDWDTKTCTTVVTGLPNGNGINSACIIGNCIYFKGPSATLYKYDINTNTHALVATLPDSAVSLYVYNNRLRIYGTYRTAPCIHMELYEATE